MGDLVTPTERVLSFVADYDAAYHALPHALDLAAWQLAVPGLEAAHFAHLGTSDLGAALGKPCLHAAVEETVVAEEQRDGQVIVETTTPTRFYEYVLELTGDGWRIVRIDEFLDPAGVPVLSPDDEARLVAAADSPLELASGEDQPHLWFDNEGLAKAIEQGHPQPLTSPVEIRHLGTFAAASGTLLVGDLGYGASTLRALTRQVPSGEYAVDVAIAFERNAALRVILREGVHVGYREGALDDGGFVIGVDAGDVAVLDASALVGLTTRVMERAFDAFARDEDRPTSAFVSFARPHDGIVLDSGWGDGGYPVYWSVDADGEILALYIDFMLGWPPGVEPTEEELVYRGP